MIPCFHKSGAPQRAPGHLAYIGIGSAVRGDVTPGLVEAVKAERLRRDLYAGCERAPEWSDAHRNLAGVQ